MNHLQEGLKALCAFVSWFGLLLSSGCSTEFWIDKGHADAIEGVVFEIKAPHLFEKKAFKLRGEHMSPWQLQQIANAMPSIAAFTNGLLENGIRPNGAMPIDANVRNIRQIQLLEHSTFLAVKTLQHWQVSEHQIQFTTDYFYTDHNGHFVYFRDNYVFQKTKDQWVFQQHARAQPEGLLGCQINTEGWRQCEPLSEAH